MTTRTLLVRCAALLTAGAALVHVGVAGEHFSQWWAAGLFLLVTAAAQLGWALWAWTRPVTRPILLAGAAGSVALVLLWVVTRTSGLPFGPQAGVAEPVGAADVVSGLLELLTVALALVATAADRRPRLAGAAPRRAAGITAGVAALVVLASGTALAAPSPDHLEAGLAAAHDHAASAGASAGAVGATAPGDAAAAGGHHHDGPNLPDTSTATPEQTAAARDLLARTIAATAAYRDPAVATKAGFDVQAAYERVLVKLTAAGRTPKQGRVMVIHVSDKANRTDGRVLDPTRPETLVYARTPQGKFELVGVMFTAEKQAPPTSYQPYLRWHTHTTCVGGGHRKAKPENGSCPAGTTERVSGAMTHVWFVSSDQLAQAFARRPPVKALLAYQKSLA
ncbi:hypothetical protein GCM10027517_00160 [Phycicoccus ginsengisoli]